jgi:PhnB protein
MPKGNATMYVPPGFCTVTPYFFINNAQGLVEFLIQGLGGRETCRTMRPDGVIANVQVQLGTSTVMISEATERFGPMCASYYLYVDDAEVSTDRAVACGATLLMPVMDMPYGDRQGGVRDQWGNVWWISQRIVQEPYSS